MRNIKNTIAGNHHTRMCGRARHSLLGDFGINLPGKNNRVVFALPKHQIVRKILDRYICPSREIAQTFSRVLTRASITHDLIAPPEPCLEFGDGLSANPWIFKTRIDLIWATDLKFHGQHHVQMGHPGRIKIRFKSQIDIFALDSLQQIGILVVDPLVRDVNRDICSAGKRDGLFPCGNAPNRVITHMSRVNTPVFRRDFAKRNKLPKIRIRTRLIIQTQIERASPRLHPLSRKIHHLCNLIISCRSRIPPACRQANRAMRNLRIHICRAVIGKKTQIIFRRLPANRYIDLANGKARICPQFARALGRQPRPSKPIGRQKLRGNALLHLGIAVNTREKGNFRMNMHIDKTGTDDMSHRIDNRIGLCLRQIANGLNAIPTNANICLKTGRSARTVNDCAAANNEIKSHFLPPYEKEKNGRP